MTGTALYIAWNFFSSWISNNGFECKIGIDLRYMVFFAKNDEGNSKHVKVKEKFWASGENVTLVVVQNGNKSNFCFYKPSFMWELNMIFVKVVCLIIGASKLSHTSNWIGYFYSMCKYLNSYLVAPRMANAGKFEISARGCLCMFHRLLVRLFHILGHRFLSSLGGTLCKSAFLANLTTFCTFKNETDVQ